MPDPLGPVQTGFSRYCGHCLGRWAVSWSQHTEALPCKQKQDSFTLKGLIAATMPVLFSWPFGPWT